jgi:hypothetical protein
MVSIYLSSAKLTALISMAIPAANGCMRNTLELVAAETESGSTLTLVTMPQHEFMLVLAGVDT